MSADCIAARVHRGSSIEAVHAASIAVVDGRGKLVASFGDPEQRFSFRSATKPFQALPLVTSGAADAFGLDQRELAIACASHNGSDLHVGVVESVLARANAGPEALDCGSELPIGLRLSHQRPTRGEERDPLRHNCSGKHAGFLLLSRHLGESFEAYLKPNGRVQTLVRERVAGALGLAPDALDVAVDGCSAPTFAAPLSALARGFASLAGARASDAAKSPEGDTTELVTALGRVRDAMQAEPLLVSGEGRLDYALARSFPGNVVNKAGAEAILGIGFRDPPLGIVVKIHDGSERALGPVTLAVLRELGLVLDIERVPLLARHERPVIKNHQKRPTGEIVATVSLRREP